MRPKADIFTVPLAFRAAEVGPDGQVNLFHVADLLQEAAGIHAERLGFGMSDLASHDLTWALMGLRIRLNEPVCGQQTYMLHTWPSGTERLWAFRRFLITCEGRECGQALTRWMVLHRDTHRPSRLPSFLTDREWPEPPAEDPVWTDFGDGGATWQTQETFAARFTEIDTNGHVNNAHYLAWCLNATPRPILEHQTPLETHIRFEAETKWGDLIQVSTAHEETPNLVTHYRVESDGRSLARAHILWKPMLR